MQNDGKIKITFKLNNEEVETCVFSETTVLEMLRGNFALTAAKEGCGKGECGACSAILNGKQINTCLKLAATLKFNDSLITLEGLNNDELMKNIQRAYIEEGAVQCGFCTPGMVIASYVLLKSNPKPTEQEIKHALSGNLCRCTGYKKIEAAVKKAASRR